MKALSAVSLIACMAIALLSAGCGWFSKGPADKIPDVSPKVVNLQVGMSIGTVKQTMKPLTAIEGSTPVLTYDIEGLRYYVLFYSPETTLTAVLVAKFEPTTTTGPATTKLGKMWFYLPEEKRGQQFKGTFGELNK